MSLRTETRTRFAYVLQYPTDLAVTSALAVLGYLLVMTFPTGSYLRLTAALALVAALPGYALVSVLFPAGERRARVDARTDLERRPGGIDSAERFGLAVPLSSIVASIVAIALPLLGWELATEPVAVSLAIVTLAFAQVGALRRLRVPEPDRYAVAPRRALRRVRRSGEGAVAAASSALLVLAVVAAAGMLLVAFVVPQSAGSYSQLELYSEDENGDLVAGALPDEVAPGESIPITFTVENYEGAKTEYTVVVQEQVVEDGEVVERTELRTVDVLVTHGDGGWVTAEREVSLTASVGETVRVSVLLFEGDPPATPTNENADEDVYFWTTVVDPADTDAASDGTGAGDADETASDDEGSEGNDEGGEGEGSEGEGEGAEGDDPFGLGDFFGDADEDEE